MNLFFSSTDRVTQSEIRNDTGFSAEYFSGFNRVDNELVFSAFNPTASMSTITEKPGYGKAIPEVNASISREALYNEVRKSIRGEYVNLAVMLSEYRETAKLFYDLANVVKTRGDSLLKRHPDLRGRRHNGRVDIPTTAAAAHLQFQYGIKPLMQDLGTSIGELAGAIPQEFYVQGVKSRKGKAAGVGYQTGTIGTAAYAKVEILSTQFIRTRYAARLVPGAVKQTLSQHGLLNPLSVAWEKLPFSFVIDWFVDVGDTLASLDNMTIYDKLYVIDSQSDRTARRYVILDGQNGLKLLRPGEGFYFWRQDVRYAAKAISLVMTPMYKPSASLAHITNGLALLRTLYKK